MSLKSSANVLVTGSSGYIGRHFCRLLDRNGINWVGVDLRAETGRSRREHQIDILDTKILAEFLAKHRIDLIVHLAGLALAGESFEKSIEYMRVNAGGTASLLKAVEDSPIRGLVFSSSCSVYGSGIERFTEDSNFDPKSPYARSKVESERVLRETPSKHSTIILRFFNVVGGEEDGTDADNHDPEPHVLPNLVRAALSGGSVQVFGSDYLTHDGTTIREYVDVRDIARAMLLSVEAIGVSPRIISRVYNIGSERDYSILELSALVGKIIGPVDLEFCERRLGDPDAARSDSSLARKELGWSAKHPMEDSIEAQKLYFVNNEASQGPAGV